MERNKRKERAAKGKKAKATCEESLASNQRCESVLKHPKGKGGKGKRKTGVSTIARLPFGIMRHNLEDLSPNNALFFYERDQLLWLRLGAVDRKRCRNFGFPALQALQKQCPSLFKNHWSVENPGDQSKESLAPNAVFGRVPVGGRYYVSSILQKDDASLKKFYEKVPFAEVDLLRQAKATHDDGVWLFVACNKRPPGTKPKRKAEEPLHGRPEHTDAVNHSGTWHVQLKGHKTWFVRPCAQAADWESSPPVLEKGKEGVVEAPDGRGGLRLRIQCEEGDLLLINTRAWWHRTDIEPQDDEGFSMSYARDFYLSGVDARVAAAEGGCKTNDDTLDPRMLAARNFKAEEVVLCEEDLPDTDLPRSGDPNCSMAELDDGSEALVSLRRIRKGEPLTVGIGQDSDADEYEEWELDPDTGEMLKVGG